MRRAEEGIDGTARRDAWILLLGDGDVAVGVEPLTGAAVSPSAGAAAAEDGHAAGAEVAALDHHAPHRAIRPDGEQLHDAAERVGAVEVAAAAAVDLDAVDRRLRH